MSDTVNEKKTFKLTKDLLLEFSQARGVDPRCPQCHHDKWALFGNEEDAVTDGVTLARAAPDGSPDASHVLSFAFMVCVNCGMPRMFAWPVIQKWLADRNKGAS